MSRKYTLHELIVLVARRRWIILLPVALGVAAIPLLVQYVPKRYRSDALILVVPQQVPDNYVKPTVSQSVAERLPSITDQILSRSRLERIIQEMDLYKAERARQVMEDVVETMRRDVTTSATGKDVDSFKISYVSDDPEKARKVTERLASLYIDQNLKDRETEADNTSEFLDTQLAESKRRLLEQEKKLEEYRKTHAGQLPTQLQGNLQAIQNANLQLQALNESNNRALERRLLIERQLADLQNDAIQAALPPASPDGPPPPSTARQLELARARLAQLLLVYTPDHPQIISLQRSIADLSDRLDKESQSGADAAEPAKPANPTQAKRAADLQDELAVIDHQLQADRTEEANLKATIADYQAKVDVVPTRESELTELTRDYGTLQTQYANLLMKREDSVIAANLERRQIGEQFKLLDAASLPEKPYNVVQRLLIIGSAPGAGFLMGLLIIGVLEYRDSSFRSKEEVLKTLSLPVLATIPMMISGRERVAMRRRGWMVDAGGVMLLLSVAAVLVFWHLHT